MARRAAFLSVAIAYARTRSFVVAAEQQKEEGGRGRSNGASMSMWTGFWTVASHAGAWLEANRPWIEPLGAVATAIGVAVAVATLLYSARIERSRYEAHLTAVVWRKGVRVGVPAATAMVFSGEVPPEAPRMDRPPPFTNVDVPFVLVRNLSHRPTAILEVRVLDIASKALGGGWRLLDEKLPKTVDPWSVLELRIEIDTDVVRGGYSVMLRDMDDRVVRVTPLTA